MLTSTLHRTRVATSSLRSRRPVRPRRRSIPLATFTPAPSSAPLLALADAYAARVLDGDIALGPKHNTPEGARWKLAELDEAIVWLVTWTPGVTLRRTTAEALTVLAGALRVQRWGASGRAARTVTAGGQAGFMGGVKHALTPVVGSEDFYAVHVEPTKAAVAAGTSSVKARSTEPELLFADELAARVTQGAKVVDIRSQRERSEQGPLLGALAVEAELLEHRLDPAGALRLRAATANDVEWIVVSAHGTDAIAAVTSLRRRGLRRVKALAGGYASLRENGQLDAVLGGVHNHRDAAVMAAH